MSEIRERVAEYVQGLEVGYESTHHPESECPADRDCRALLDAGDTLAAAAQVVVDGTPPEIRLTFGPYAHLRAALAAWKAATG